jgi:T4 bacteriophage base plate protein
MTTIEHLTFADIAERESTVRRRLSLPGGIVAADGTVHRCVRVRELTGADEEALFDRESKSDAQRVSAFLARVIESVEESRQTIDTTFVENLSIGDRDYLLLRMRQLDLGDAVHQVARCPSCSQKVDIDFSISELPLRRTNQPQLAYSVEIGGHRLTVRFPNGADQAAVETLATINAAAANTALFSRVVLDIDGKGPPTEDDARAWPIALRAELATWLDANAPGPDLFIDIACPHCRADMSYSFDLDAFFLPSASQG